MRTIAIGEYRVFLSSKEAEPKYRKELSKLLIKKYGKGPFVADTIHEMLLFCKQYYVQEFEKIIKKEKSFTFYKNIVWFHEMASELRRSAHFNNLPEEIDKSYIAQYRRTLKMILEQACEVNMVSGEVQDLRFVKRAQPILNDLLFLGNMMVSVSETLAEQQMIEDVSDISFDKKGLYVFRRRHHYEFVFRYISDKQESDEPEYIIDESGDADFKKGVLDHFGIDIAKLFEAVTALMLHFKLEFMDCISCSKGTFEKDLANYMEVSVEQLEAYLSGLTLSKHNKLNLDEVLKKPHSLKRHLYRPILVWNINGNEFYVFGLASYYEAEVSLYLNAIPWNKMPDEWSTNPAFKKYVHEKHDAHDKWLDDNVEALIKNEAVIYQRTVKKFMTKTGVHSLIVENIGEIDFIVISKTLKKIFVIDCKHLLGRYSIVDQKNDFDHFVKPTRDGYITRLNLKTNWMNNNREVVEQHFQLREKDDTLALKDFAIEGIFVINTPTFHMYNSSLRIYTYQDIVAVINGTHVDPTITGVVTDDESETIYNVKYPYFKKPRLLRYHNPDDEYEVDKYGFPIK